MSNDPDHPLGSIVAPAVENYRALTKKHARNRASVLISARFKQAEQRLLIGLTSLALLVATALLLLLAASAHSEERPFIWPPNDEIVEVEGPWAPLGNEPAEETFQSKTATPNTSSDDVEINR